MKKQIALIFVLFLLRGLVPLHRRYHTTNLPVSTMWEAPPNPLLFYKLQAFLWAMVLSSYMTHSYKSRFSQSKTSFSMHYEFNNTSHHYAWILNGKLDCY
jgi:hypothetical protein